MGSNINISKIEKCFVIKMTEEDKQSIINEPTKRNLYNIIKKYNDDCMFERRNNRYGEWCDNCGLCVDYVNSFKELSGELTICGGKVEDVEEEEKMITINTKDITLKKVGYQINGVVKCLLWDGNIGYTKIKPFSVQTLEEQEIRANLNDNGFGCQKILGGYVVFSIIFERNVILPVDLEDGDGDMILGDIMEDDMTELASIFYDVGVK